MSVYPSHVNPAHPHINKDARFLKSTDNKSDALYD